jgi:predicted dehydrogenase
MKKIYEEKLVGETFNIESRVLGGRGIPGDWRGVKEFGGGMLYDWGVHLIDQMLQLVPGPISKVYCIVTNITNKEVDDGFKLLLTFQNGVTTLIEVGTCNFISMPMWYQAGDQGTAIIHDWDMEGGLVKLRSWEDSDAKPIVAGTGVTKTMAPREGYSIEKLPIPRIDKNPREYYHNVFDYREGKAEILVKNEEVMRVLRLIEVALKSAELNEALDFE